MAWQRGSAIMNARRDPLLDLLHAIIREPDSAERVRHGWADFLAGFGLEPRDRDALLEAPRERVLVYRRLVFHRFLNTVREFVPRTAARLGRELFRASVTTFIAEHASRSPYLRDVPGEFVRWAMPRWDADPSVASYLSNLAHHELLEFEILNEPHADDDEPTPVALERPLRFHGSTRLMQYRYAVHRLSADERDRTIPEASHVHLLAYRDVDHRVRYLELSEFAARLLTALRSSQTSLHDALNLVCDRVGDHLDDAQLATAAQLLADLAERGVMLGAKSDIIVDSGPSAA